MSICVEKKITLSGAVHEYRCELLHLAGDFGVLKHVIEQEYDVNGLKLKPGDITRAFYWRDRPYTLYVWQLTRRTAYYFNIADSVSLARDSFVWRDLAVDILVAGRLRPRVLDEDELPPDLSAALLHKIHAARNTVLRDYSLIIREIELLLPSYP